MTPLQHAKPSRNRRIMLYKRQSQKRKTQRENFKEKNESKLEERDSDILQQETAEVFPC